MTKFYKGSHLIYPVLYKFRLEEASLHFLRVVADERKISRNALVRQIIEEFLERELPGFSKKSYETGKLSPQFDPDPVPLQPVQQPFQAPAQPQTPTPNSRPVLPEERAPDEPQPDPAPVQSPPAQSEPLVAQVPSEAEALTPEIIKYLKGLPPEYRGDPDKWDLYVNADSTAAEDMKWWRNELADRLVDSYTSSTMEERRGFELYIRKHIEALGWNMEDYFPPMGWAHFKIPPERQEIADTFESVEPSALADPSLAGLMSSPAEPQLVESSIPGLESQLDPPDWTKSADAQEAFAMIDALAKEQKRSES